MPVFWPVLVVYFLILFSLTSEFFFFSRVRPSFLSPFRLCVRNGVGFLEIMMTIADGQYFYLSAEANTAHDQIPLRALFVRQGQIQPAERALSGHFSYFRVEGGFQFGDLYFLLYMA